jgi:hypothetical protein
MNGKHSAEKNAFSLLVQTIARVHGPGVRPFVLLCHGHQWWLAGLLNITIEA